MKAKMDQANDVTSPPLNSCLSERYDEVTMLKCLNIFPSYDNLFYRNASNVYTNILTESLVE